MLYSSHVSEVLQLALREHNVLALREHNARSVIVIVLMQVSDSMYFVNNVLSDKSSMFK